MAIMEGNEDKAIAIYQSKDGNKSLMTTLNPSKPIPSKKAGNDETPMHLTAKYALVKLFEMFLEYGGNPNVPNSRHETCAHTVCTLQSNPAKRADILEAILSWHGVRPDNSTEAVSIDEIDIDGNTAVHLAAYNGLLYCVEKLVYHQANLVILNRSNLTCAEYADVGGRAAFGTMLELAILYHTAENSADSTEAYQQYAERPATPIVLSSDSMTLTALMKFMAQAIGFICDSLGENAARAEVLLSMYRWNAGRLKREFLQDAQRVLEDAGLLPSNKGHLRSAIVPFNGKLVYSFPLSPFPFPLPPFPLSPSPLPPFPLPPSPLDFQAFFRLGRRCLFVTVGKSSPTPSHFPLPISLFYYSSFPR